MNIKTIEKEFKKNGLECKVEKFKSSKVKGNAYIIHRKNDITLGIKNNGGRLVVINSLDDIKTISVNLNSENY